LELCVNENWPSIDTWTLYSAPDKNATLHSVGQWFTHVPRYARSRSQSGSFSWGTVTREDREDFRLEGLGLGSGDALEEGIKVLGVDGNESGDGRGGGYNATGEFDCDCDEDERDGGCGGRRRSRRVCRVANLGKVAFMIL
jgi:hypothetical protein